MSKVETGSAKALVEAVAAGSHDAMERVAKAATLWNATLRTTCVATQLEGGHAMNALPQLAAATVNCRVLPEDSPQYVEETLRKIIADDQVTLKTTGEMSRGPASPLRPDLLAAASQ